MSLVSKHRQIEEIVKCGKDPVYFMNKYVKVRHPQKGMIKFDTYPFQDDCIEDFVEHRFNIILKSRQLGISTLVAAYAVWLTSFYKSKSVLIIATKLDVAQNFIRKVKTAIRSMPKWLLLPEIIGNNKQLVEFNNGSQIKAVPTSDDAGRSEALSLLVVDEAAFVRNFDTLWTSLYPTLSTGGRAIVLSTPNGVGGQYYDLYRKAVSGENEFNPIKLPWDVHPERDAAWFEKEVKNFTKKQIAQELMCDFVSSGDTFFKPEDVKKVSFAIREPVDRWGPEGNVWVWKYPKDGHEYVISADVARGDGADYSTFHVIDVHDSEVVAEFKGKLPPDRFALVLSEAGKRYNEAIVCPENNTFGYAVIMKLRDIGYANLYFANERDRFDAKYGIGEIDLSKVGFTTSGRSRDKILTKMEQFIRNDKIKIYSSRFYDEMKSFVWKGKKAQAMKGKNDDLVMSLAIGIWLYDAEAPTNYELTSKLNEAMLSGFAVNKKSAEVVTNPWKDVNYNPFKPVTIGSMPASGSNTVYGDFSWLL